MSGQDAPDPAIGMGLNADDSSSAFLAFAQAFDDPNSDDVNSGSDFLGSNDDGLFEELELLHMLQSSSMLQSPSFTPTHGHVDALPQPEAGPSVSNSPGSATRFRPPLTLTTNGAPPPKIGTRFSRDSVRILRNWLTTHSRNPFASEEDKEMLQRQTGLSKTQIANWLSNARRRGKIQGPNLALPQPPDSSTASIEIHRRPGTPAPKSRTELMNPLERWVDSPPENEPATATAIARAMASSSRVSSGNTMADWNGDWGFDTDVLARLENSIPPYFIETERNTPFPFEASNAPPESPPNAYGLIELELMHFVQGFYDGSRKLPTSDEIQFEACRIILASEALSTEDSPSSSWLRDLIMSSESIVRQAKFSPMRSSAERRLPLLKINGQDGLFDSCPLEIQLHDFVRAGQSAPLTDQELQKEASRIIRRIEDQSTSPAEFIANWLIELVALSTSWLNGFRLRANAPKPNNVVEAGQFLADSSKLDGL
ncbi:hypothetical protein G7Z17_g4396 [Cylindrodendrum hubeiense]|uniref:Homeobox domain-containing protein n=1 Tax=Cylindrodendrum hubeiense TaxID=595255 RepID=A0A9P5H8Z9_9HYPO|nr:hypothetical protein G7Z17_g4396 [Cylindrodendrum hubeiense]